MWMQVCEYDMKSKKKKKITKPSIHDTILIVFVVSLLKSQAQNRHQLAFVSCNEKLGLKKLDSKIENFTFN